MQTPATDGEEAAEDESESCRAKLSKSVCGEAGAVVELYISIYVYTYMDICELFTPVRVYIYGRIGRGLEAEGRRVSENAVVEELGMVGGALWSLMLGRLERWAEVVPKQKSCTHCADHVGQCGRFLWGDVVGQETELSF